MGWATAQLCHNTMGNCIATQPVLGVKWAGKCIATWYSVLRLGSRESVSQYTKCIVTGEAEGGLAGRCVAIHKVVLWKKGLVVRHLYCNTPRCIVTGKGHEAAGCVATQGHDTTLGHAATRPSHTTTRPGATAAVAHDTAMRARAWARLCAPGRASWVSWLCTLCTCSVFGLSTISESLFMNTVHHKKFSNFCF